MRSCPVGAVLSYEELEILQRACAMAITLGEAVLKAPSFPQRPDQRKAVKDGIRIYRSYEKKIQKVRRAK